MNDTGLPPPTEQMLESAAEQAVATRLFTAKVEHPAKGSIRSYLQLLRRILAHPQVHSILLEVSRPIEVGYYSHALDQDLGEKLAHDIPAGEVVNRVKIEPMRLPPYEGLVHVLLAAEAINLAPCRVYVKSTELLKQVGWEQGDTFLGGVIEVLETLPKDLVVFGLAPDNACTNADVQRLWGLSLEESPKGSVSDGDPVQAGG